MTIEERAKVFKNQVSDIAETGSTAYWAEMGYREGACQQRDIDIYKVATLLRSVIDEEEKIGKYDRDTLISIISAELRKDN